MLSPDALYPRYIVVQYKTSTMLQTILLRLWIPKDTPAIAQMSELRSSFVNLLKENDRMISSLHCNSPAVCDLFGHVVHGVNM